MNITVAAVVLTVLAAVLAVLAIAVLFTAPIAAEALFVAATLAGVAAGWSWRERCR